MRVLQIGADRSKRGILFPGTDAAKRQKVYAEQFDALDIIGFSLASDAAGPYTVDELRVYPTNSPNKFAYALDAWHIFRHLQKPSVISVQDPFETGLLGLVFSRIARVPLHVQVHTDFLSPAFRKLSILNRIRVRIALYVLRRAAGIRVVSDRIRVSLMARLNLAIPVAVLPIYVDVENIRREQPNAELVSKFAHFKTKLLFVGRLEPEKNPCLVIESFAKAAPTDACLIIVGDGSERQRLETLSRELGVSDRVFLEGLQNAAPYYQLADLVLVTSRFEGYCAVIIEALAAGKPVLSTNVGIAKEAGAIVTNPEQYPEALAEWFKSGPHRGELMLKVDSDIQSYMFRLAGDIKACEVLSGRAFS